MLFATVEQPAVFLWMTACGALIGLWYSLLAGLRRLIGAGILLSLACDLLFGLGSAVLLLAALVSANYGVPRLYMLPAALLGFALFAGGILPPLRRCARALRSVFRKIRRFLSKNHLIKVIFK